MSEWHRQWQLLFPEECREVIVEHEGEKHIADIKCGRMVVEFQHSPMSAEEFEKRTRFYTESGNILIWVFDYADECDALVSTVNYEYKLEEFDSDKWRWQYAHKTFQYFNSASDDNSKIFLMFEDNTKNIRRIVWNIHDCDNECESYKRFCTRGCYLRGQFIERILHCS